MTGHRFIMTCDKHLLSGVNLRLSFRRSSDEFATISENAAKNYKVQITEANLYVRKMSVADSVLGAIEKTLLKTPAIYRYIEVIPRTFLAQNGARSWRQEDVFFKRTCPSYVDCNDNQPSLSWIK